MKTVSEVKAALVAAVKLIKTANGYSTNLADSHVYDKYDGNLLSSSTDSLFPKVCVFPVYGDTQNLPGLNETRILDFVIIALVKAVSRTSDSVVMTESLLSDFEKLFHEQHNLFGNVFDARIQEFTMDGGALSPEGCVILKVRTERFK